MNKKAQLLIPLALILLIVFLFIFQKNTKTKFTDTNTDPKNGTYIVDEMPITLVDGISDVESAPGSATHVITQYFGNEAKGDINADGKEDTAFILTQNGGGTGTFYFIVALLSGTGGYHGTNAIFLGDRIAPQTTEIRAGELIVNYADRKPSDPMTASPSVGVSKYITVKNGDLIEKRSVVPKISWQTKSITGGDTPKTSVSVAIDGALYDLGIYTGTCTEIGKSGGIDGKGLLANELSAVQCYFAGGGDEIGVFQEDGKVSIKKGMLDEGSEEAPSLRGNFVIFRTL